MPNFTLKSTNDSAVLLDANSQFHYQPIIDAQDINGNPIQVYGQPLILTRLQLADQIAKLNQQIIDINIKLTTFTAVAAEVDKKITDSQAAMALQAANAITEINILQTAVQSISNG